MKNIFGCLTVFLVICHATHSHVHTLIINKINLPFGIPDLRIAKFQGKSTFSFRQKPACGSAKAFEIMLRQAFSSGIYILPIQQGTRTSKLTLIIK